MRRTPLKRKPWRRALGTAEQRLLFRNAVLALDGGRCVMCRSQNVITQDPLDAAHIIRKHTLRKRGYGANIVYSPDAAFTLCRAHHELHDSYALRVPDSLIPERCRRFAVQYGRPAA